jgi:L-ribulokinase
MVEDGIVPGLIGYEAGQAGGNNQIDWFLKTSIPSVYERSAKQRNLSVLDLMEEKASKLAPAESGLVALDWWNGNRSILADPDLTGLLLGYSLETTPEEVYRTLVEAAAFGTRKIFETFIASGVPINEIIVSCDGIKSKNDLFMNILANVTRMEIKLAECPFSAALGSAIHAAVAVGEGRGGYASIPDAVGKMAHLSRKVFTPNNNDKKTYNRLYSEYTLLHDYFGYGHNNAMKRLKTLRTTIIEKKQR